MKELLFIFNPHSGKGQIRTKLVEIIDVFVKGGYEVIVHPTQRPEDADETADEADAAAHTEPGTVGPEPISHEDVKLPVNKRPKSEELKTPWADGRTFPGTAKNAPCPCGSGRKYKMCHGHNEQ